MKLIEIDAIHAGGVHKAVIIGLFMALLSSWSPWAALAETRNHPFNLPAQRVEIDMITSGILMDVVDTGQRLVTVGERGHIITSDDDGNTWLQAAVPVSVTLTAVHFPTPLKGWAVGFGGVILHTQDGGRTWSKQIDGSVIPAMIVEEMTPLPSHLESASFPGKTTVKEKGDRLLEKRYLRDDWQEYVDDHSCPPFLDVWFKNERQGFAVGGFGLFVKTDNGGATWQPVLKGIDNLAGHHFYGLTESGNQLILVGESGLALRSGDLGRSWTRMAMPYEGSYFGVVSGNQGHTLIAFGLRGNIVKSIDGGRQWRLLDQSVPMGSLSGGYTTPDGAIFLTGPDGTIYKLDPRNNKLTSLTQQVTGIVTLVPIKPGLLLCAGLRGITTIEY